jgi:hypothetical protein
MKNMDDHDVQLSVKMILISWLCGPYYDPAAFIIPKNLFSEQDLHTT